jgi:hypothetical protein
MRWEFRRREVIEHGVFDPRCVLYYEEIDHSKLVSRFTRRLIRWILFVTRR